VEITNKSIASAFIVLLVSVCIFFGGYFTGSHTGKNAASIAAVKVENNIQQAAAGINDSQIGIGITGTAIETVQSAIGSSQQSVATVSAGLGNIADESEKRTGKIDDCIKLARQLDDGISDIQKNYGKDDNAAKDDN